MILKAVGRFYAVQIESIIKLPNPNPNIHQPRLGFSRGIRTYRTHFLQEHKYSLCLMNLSGIEYLFNVSLFAHQRNFNLFSI